MALEQTFTLVNDLSEIPRLAEKVEALGEQGHLTARQVYQINLVLDELLTNVMSYGYTDGQRHTIDIHLNLEPAARLTAVLSDDGRPFNPLEQAPHAVLEGELDERPIGGLGIHFVRTLMDEVHYQRRDGRNILTLAKNLDPE